MATYTVYRAPIPLYYDSYLAEQKSTYKTGTLTKTGTYTVLNSRQGADGVMLYGFDIGWIRDDDNIVPSTVPTVPDMQIDGSITVNINRVASNLTHQIEIKIGTATIKKYDNVGTSCVVSFTTEEQNTIYGLLSDTTIGSMRVVCRTYLNGSQVGSYRTTDGKLFVPSSIVPKFGTNPTVTINKPINGKAYQNISSLTVDSTNNIAGQGSSITSVTIQVGNFVGTTNPYTSSVISQSGVIPVKVTITDKRSRTATYSSSVNFEAYGGIKVDSFKGERKTPTSISYGLTGSYNVNVAIPTYKLETRIMGTPTWAVVRTGNVGGTSNTMIINGELTGLDASKTYELKMTVIDATGVPYVSFLTVATEAVTMSMGIHGASFGKLFDNAQKYNVQASVGGIKSEGALDGAIGNTVQMSVTGLVADTDLNNLVKTGVYYCDYERTVKTFVNVPTGYAMMVEVYATQISVYQRCTDWQSSRFVRRRYHGAWSAWTREG